MSKKQYFLIIALVIISGFIGGVFSDRIFTDEQVFAQKTSKSKGVPLDYGLKKDEPRKKVGITEKEWKEWNKELKEIGRFKFHAEGRYILDTKQGHFWHFGSMGLIYFGRVFPGKGIGEEIVSIPTF